MHFVKNKKTPKGIFALLAVTFRLPERLVTYREMSLFSAATARPRFSLSSQPDVSTANAKWSHNRGSKTTMIGCITLGGLGAGRPAGALQVLSHKDVDRI